MVKLFDTFEVDLPEYLNNQWAEFLILMALWMLIGLLVMLLIRVMTRLALRTEGSDVDDRVVKTISGPVLLLVFGYGLIESLRVLDAMPGWLVDNLLFVYSVLVAGIVVYLSYKIFRLVFIPITEGVSKKRKQKYDRAVYDLFESVGSVVILIFGFFWVLTVLGMNVTVFLAGAGIAGLVIAFAMQDTLSNYFSGLHLLLDKPFDLGDTIEVNGEFMEVLRIGMRSTRLYNIFDHEIEIVPNNILANQTISNVTEPDNEYRASVEVGVAYGSSIDKVKEILFESVTTNDEVVIDDGDKRPRVSLTDFGSSALEFRIRFFVKDVMEQWSVKTAVREHIYRRFHEEGITIPFPQTTLSILPPHVSEVVQVQHIQPQS
ncbi:MAG: mechanosensitive ion channel [Thermoplasmata archaeon]|nr:mechanosensitive ion channel [Thermoplasmata archaeon]